MEVSNETSDTLTIEHCNIRFNCHPRCSRTNLGIGYTPDYPTKRVSQIVHDNATSTFPVP